MPEVTDGPKFFSLEGLRVVVIQPQPGMSLRRRLAAYAACGVLFALFQLVWDRQTFLTPGYILRGWGSDALFFCWDLWWVATNAWEIPGGSFLHCPMMFSPEGIPFLWSSHVSLYGWLYAALQAPFRWCGWLSAVPSPVLGYNLLTLLSTALTGMAAVAVCRATARVGFGPALLAGFSVSFCSFRLFSFYGHLNYTAMELLLWGVWAIYRATHPTSGTGWRWWTLGGAFAGLTWLNGYYFGIFLTLFWLFSAGWAARWAPRGHRLKRLAVSLLFWVPCTLLAGFFWIEMASLLASQEYVVDVNFAKRSCDVFNFLVPTLYHGFLAGPCEQLGKALGVEADYDIAFLGWHQFWTLGWGFVLWRRLRRAGNRPLSQPRARFWVWIGGLSLLFSFGEVLSVFGLKTMDLPGGVLFGLPIIENIRAAERFGVFTALAGGVLAGCIAAYLIRTARPAKAWIFAGGWALLFLVHVVPYFAPHVDVRERPYRLPHPVLETIRVSPADAQAQALWILPISYNHRTALWWQTRHGRPMVFGGSSRDRRWLRESREASYPFLAAVNQDAAPDYFRALDRAGGPEGLREQMNRFVQDHCVGFVLVRKTLWPGGMPLVWEGLPGALLLYEDSDLALFRVNR